MPLLVRLSFMWLAVSGSGTLGAAPASEYQVKAAYLFNFGQFVEWPASAFESPSAPFAICIVGDDPFGSIIDDAVRGEKLEGRAVEVRRFRNPEEAAGCNIVFLARSEAGRLEQTLHALHGRPVLTVTDATGAETRDAAIVLITQNNRVRLRINLAEARANNLVISSKLLRPAEVVGNTGATP
ncbi:MAG TPA: YfiR family protein [Steroidobacteraceae bacterium]|jgi:hypothetical protein|nr:YfiR family protein [Steroidobacteraceae bacterium]